MWPVGPIQASSVTLKFIPTMAVNIRPNQSADVPQALAPDAMFRSHIQSRVDGYCTSDDLTLLTRYGVDTCGLDTLKAQIILNLELERQFVANERQLLQNLHDSLYRFTASDRKLDAKEHKDAIQLVCKAAPGYRHGLNLQLAEAALISYCRANQIKMKTGLFTWAVP